MTASVGYWMGIDYVRRGYMRRGIGFEEITDLGRCGLNRIEAYVDFS